MINFEDNYFQKLNFTPPQLKRYFRAAANDLAIADNAKEAEVIFRFSYDAFIKLGIALIAKQGFKARSVVGHHVKIIEKLSQILRDNDIEVYGNQMRKLRNIDFYEGGVLITEKQANDFFEFVRKIFKRTGEA